VHARRWAGASTWGPRGHHRQALPQVESNRHLDRRRHARVGHHGLLAE